MDLKFLHIVSSKVEEISQGPVIKTGYFCWHAAFKGEVGQWINYVDKDLSQYKIILVTMAKPEVVASTISRVRERLGDNPNKTLVVTIMDYACELWNQGYPPHHVRRELLQADMIFGNIHQHTYMLQSVLKNEKKTYVLDHPADLKGLRGTPHTNPDTETPIGCAIHRYDNNWYAPYLTVMNLPHKYGALIMDHNLLDQIKDHFEIRWPGCEYPKFLTWMKNRRMIIDSYHYLRVWGRLQIEAACMGTPIIGTNMVINQEKLWPRLTTEPADTYRQEQLARKLMLDDEFHAEVCRYAQENVDQFGYDKCKRRFLEALYDATQDETIRAVLEAGTAQGREAAVSSISSGK